ncbi:MAG: hypothetical protein ACLU0Z_06600, partial [Oscillospiraceae bacterium]
VFSSPHMSPKKMIGLSLRPQAQRLRGSLTVWPPLDMRGGMKSSPAWFMPDCSIQLGRSAPVLPPAAQTIYAAALALGQ